MCWGRKKIKLKSSKLNLEVQSKPNWPAFCGEGWISHMQGAQAQRNATHFPAGNPTSSASVCVCCWLPHKGFWKMKSKGVRWLCMFMHCFTRALGIAFPTATATDQNGTDFDATLGHIHIKPGRPGKSFLLLLLLAGWQELERDGKNVCAWSRIRQNNYIFMSFKIRRNTLLSVRRELNLVAVQASLHPPSIPRESFRRIEQIMLGIYDVDMGVHTTWLAGRSYAHIVNATWINHEEPVAARLPSTAVCLPHRNVS